MPALVPGGGMVCGGVYIQLPVDVCFYVQYNYW